MTTCSECGNDTDRPKRGKCNRCYLIYVRTTPPEDRTSVRPGPDPGDIDARFDSHVQRGEPDECWPWTGATIDGYGAFGIAHGKNMRANRYALSREAGPPPDDEHNDACHTCDNPPCCNPRHLYWGTRGQNMRDAVDRGRTATRERHGHHRLTTDQRQAVRDEYTRGGITQAALADKHGVGRATVYRIIHDIGWK